MASPFDGTMAWDISNRSDGTTLRSQSGRPTMEFTLRRGIIHPCFIQRREP
jgi:hypothetical protein